MDIIALENAFGVGLVAAGATACVFLLAFVLVGAWMTLRKLGESPWAGLVIPWGAYLLCRRCWEAEVYKRVLARLIAAIVCAGALVGISLALSVQGIAEQGTVLSAIVCILVFLGGVSVVWFLAGCLQLCIRVARAFGRSLGWGIGLFILPPIFWLALGFGESQPVLAVRAEA